jgi:hypothetical protein
MKVEANLYKDKSVEQFFPSLFNPNKNLIMIQTLNYEKYLLSEINDFSLLIIK